MTDIYTRGRAAATRLLTEYGQVISFSRKTITEPDNPWEKPTETTQTLSSINAVASGFSPHRIDGKMIEAGDLMVTADVSVFVSAGIEPRIDDQFLINGEYYRVHGVRAVPPDGVNTVAYKIHVKRL